MATLQESMESMKGVGEKHKYALASFLERNQLRGAKAMDEVLYGEDGFVARAKALDDTLDDHGREMLTKITDLFKESVGKGASETRDILTKMKVLQETLGKSTDEQSNQLSELIRGGGIQALEKQGSLFNVTKDIVRGKVAGFKDKMIRKIPFVGGLAADVLGERKRRKRLAADQKSELEASGIEPSGIEPSGIEPSGTEPSGTEEPKEEKGPGGLSKLASETTSLEEKVRGFVGLRRKTPEEKLLVKIHKLLLTRLPRKDGGAKLEERETLLEKTKSKVGGFLGKLSGRNKEGGGLGGLGGLLRGLLPAGLLGALAGGMTGILSSMLGAIGGVAVLGPALLVIATAAMAAGVGYLIGNHIANNVISPWFEKRDDAASESGRTKSEDRMLGDEKAFHLKGVKGEEIAKNLGRSLVTESEAKQFAEEAGVSVEDIATQASKVTMAGTGTGFGAGQTEDMSSVKEAEAQYALQQENEQLGRMRGGDEAGLDASSKSLLILHGGILYDLEKQIHGYLGKDLSNMSEAGRTKEELELQAVLDRASDEFDFLRRKIGWDGRKQGESLSSKMYRRMTQAFPLAYKYRNGNVAFTDKSLFLDPAIGFNKFIGDVKGDFGEPGDALKKMGGGKSLIPAWDTMPGNFPFLQKGGITKQGGLAFLHPNEAVIPLSSAMVPQTGTLSEGAKLLIQTLMGNALFKGTEPTMGGGGGGAVIAPITSNSVISNTDNIFSGTPSTRNSEPSFREMQRLLYA